MLGQLRIKVRSASATNQSRADGDGDVGMNVLDLSGFPFPTYITGIGTPSFIKRCRNRLYSYAEYG
jgi:hypothetical protein